DFTFPARRDSQYAISLRQWRFAESCELGLARREDPRLCGALWELYEHSPVAHRDTGRWRSTAESERNEPASALSRADLGWRSLLFARENLPLLERARARSALLESQGIAVLRRDAGRIYTALDYGHAGGGHGHPDRLNLLVAVESERWLDDVGTGSYVDPTLFWYRSTLAHNAPLIDGRSQAVVNGTLRAYDERGAVGWVDAAVPQGGIALDVAVRRSLVMMPDYLVDRLEWSADRVVSFALPLHIDAELDGINPLQSASFDGSPAREDGFSFITGASAASVDADATVLLKRSGAVRAWATVSRAATWWRLRGPGAPGSGPADFVLVCARAATGVVHVVWDFRGGIARVDAMGDTLRVEMVRGERHEHGVRGAQWHIALESAGARSSITLDGSRTSPVPPPPAPSPAAQAPPALVPRAPDAPLRFDLGADAYRRSEQNWVEAGRPAAVVQLSVDDTTLIVIVAVRKSPLVFRDANAPDPELDNEDPDIHSDGAQLYLAAARWTAPAGWLAVPAPDGTVRMRTVDGMRRDISCVGSWARAAAGYTMRFAIPLAALGESGGDAFGLEVVVNDMVPGRTRRRGQLVLSGARGETTFLRGDREDAAYFLRFRLPDV
ncbi:MAG: heparinase II/III domain-containing protein, partial [Gemmatimonadaceae bacterium]